MTDETDVTGDEERPTVEERLGVLEDAVGLAHRHIRGLKVMVSTNEAQVIILGLGLVFLAAAIIIISRGGEVTADVGS